MKKAKGIIALFISLTVFLSSVLPCYALTNDEEPLMHKNPFYEGRKISYSTLDSVDASEHSVSRTLNSNTYYSDGVELYKLVRNNLVKRKTSFILYYLSADKIYTESVLNKIDKIYANATDDALSQSPTDGDYIRWVVSGFGIGTLPEGKYWKEEYKNGYYYYKLNLRFNYYDSASEEKEVDRVVNSFVSSVNTDELTDYEVIKKIHDFICSKTTYDDYAAYDIEGREYVATAYGALVKGKCVCQGYSVAFYRLCKELGYNVRFVSSDPDWGCHAWNIVALDGKYYFVDATWDDTYIDGGETSKSHTYFLVDYKTLRSDDSYKSEHALDSDFYDDEYFWENYRKKLDSKKYDQENKELLSQSKISLSKKKYIYSGEYFKPEVSVNSGTVPDGYVVSYSDNKKTGMATVNITSDDGKTLISHRNFIIIPKKMTALSLEEGGRANNSITVKWDKAAESVAGYSIEVYRNGAWNTAKTVSSSATSAAIDSLGAGYTYKFRIRSYSGFSARKFYGAYSDVYQTATKPKKPTVTSVSTKSKSILLKWNGVNCTGYELQYSTNKSMKNAQTVKLSSSAVSKRIKNLKKGKRYYIRIRAYKEYKSSSDKLCKCSSLWSTKKNIVCK